jgi:plastocyanin
MRHALTAGSTVLLALLLAGPSPAAETEAHEVTLTLKDHRFTPEQIEVPAGRKIRIELINLDPVMEEFDSEDLRVERDVTPRGKVSFEIGPLKPGRYDFMGEMHADTASGTITAVAGQ